MNKTDQPDLFGADETPVCAHLDLAAQQALVTEIVSIIGKAPLFRPTMPRSGQAFSVLMSNCGPLGWVSDEKGYRYQPHHPQTGRPWPAMPQSLLDLWAEQTAFGAPPEACLINYYAPDAKMGLHQDRDEKDFDAPVLSISLGDDARFRLGGTKRGGRTRSFMLKSGDVMTLSGESRLAFHGIDRVYAGTSDLLAPHRHLFAAGGRLNLTLRRVS